MKSRSMKLTLLLLCFVIFSARAQSTYLDEGEKVTIYPKVEWIKGTPVTTFDKDKIYVVELWATWCKPCIAAIPHLNKLSKKFKDQIIFVGQDVMEGDKSKVEAFVKAQGERMSYNVAYGGPEGSDFDKLWIKASGTSGIPRSFVIQNNTLLWMTHPQMLNEEILQLLVDKKFTKEAAEALIKERK